MSSNNILLIGKVLVTFILLFLGACISSFCAFYVTGRSVFSAIPCGLDGFNGVGEAILLGVVILASFSCGIISALTNAYTKSGSLKRIITIEATQLFSAFMVYSYFTWPNVFFVAPICE